MEWIEGVIAIVMGKVWGSFINICIDRFSLRYASKEYHKQLLLDPKISIKLKNHILNDDLSPLQPTRSFCFACGHQLQWRELIPLVSYFITSGKCSFCNISYGTRMFWVELSHGLFFGAVYVGIGFHPATLLLCIDFSFLMFLIYAHDSQGLRKVLKSTGLFLFACNGMLIL